MAKEFIIPDFLEGQSYQETLTRMLGELPDWMDKTEGSVAHDFVAPTAIEKSQLCEFAFVELMKNMFPQWAYGINLDYHAELRGLYRKEAIKATGEITATVTGTVTIPTGTRFSSEATYGAESVEFESVEEITITTTGTVPIRAITAGSTGNVSASRITIVSTPVQGIVAISNSAATKGGADTETDESLREKILEYDYNQGSSFIGCLADYKRWALSVSGVGSALVIPPEDDTGIITIVLTDANGDPATTELCETVNDFIMRPDDPTQRLAQINAQLAVVPPETITVEVSATITISEGASLAEIKTALVASLKEYYKQALVDGEVRIFRVVQLLMEIDGVEDASGLTINGTTANVTIESDELPITTESDVVFV